MDDTQRAFRARMRSGTPVTLVLGAGVSVGRGIPLWSDLLRRAWECVLGGDPYKDDTALLSRAREAAQQAGLPPDFISRLDVRRHPLELQFAFERIYDAIRWRPDDPQLVKRLGLSRRRRPAHVSKERIVAEIFGELLAEGALQHRPAAAARPTRAGHAGACGRHRQAERGTARPPAPRLAGHHLQRRRPARARGERRQPPAHAVGGADSAAQRPASIDRPAQHPDLPPARVRAARPVALSAAGGRRRAHRHGAAARVAGVHRRAVPGAPSDTPTASRRGCLPARSAAAASSSASR